VNVWASILGDYIIGPYFFGGKTNGEEYRKFLEYVLRTSLGEVCILWIYLNMIGYRKILIGHFMISYEIL